MRQISIDGRKFRVEENERPAGREFILQINTDKQFSGMADRIFLDVPDREAITNDLIKQKIERWKESHDIDRINSAGVMEVSPCKDVIPQEEP